MNFKKCTIYHKLAEKKSQKMTQTVMFVKNKGIVKYEE